MLLTKFDRVYKHTRIHFFVSLLSLFRFFFLPIYLCLFHHPLRLRILRCPYMEFEVGENSFIFLYCRTQEWGLRNVSAFLFAVLYCCCLILLIRAIFSITCASAVFQWLCSHAQQTIKKKDAIRAICFAFCFNSSRRNTIFKLIDLIRNIITNAYVPCTAYDICYAIVILPHSYF